MIVCVCVRLGVGLVYQFLARDVIYTSRAYATMSVSVCLSVTEVHWRIIANLGFKFRSTCFSAVVCVYGLLQETPYSNPMSSTPVAEGT